MPEKSVSEISRATRELFEKGNAALQRQNLDYALAIFSQILQGEPGFYDCREALRATQYKRAGAGTGFFKKMLGTASKSPLLAKAQILLRNNPLEAITVLEQILSSDPTSVAAHRLLAEAAIAADLPRTAILSLEIALKQSPQDRDIALRLGEVLAQAGQIVRAEGIYTDLLQAYPNDQHIAQSLKNLSARRTMSEGGYDAVGSGDTSYRDLLRDKAEAASLEQENRQVKSEDVIDALIRDYEARIPSEPRNLTIIRSLAELYSKRNQFDRALDYYHRLQDAEGGGDPTIEKAISDVIVKRFDHEASLLDPTAPDFKDAMARLETEKRNYQLTECQKRAERYPHDLQISFELGQICLEAGKINEAIREFQKAQNNPHRRIASMNYLGQCFLRRGMYDLAARRFQDAIKEKTIFDEEKKELVYWLGTVLEKMGRRDEAIEQFKQIYEIDVSYRDVAERVDAYYASQSGS